MSAIPISALPKTLAKPEASDALLKDWLNWQGDFFALATEHGLTLDQLIAWFRSDTTQRRLSELAALADARSALLAKLHRAAAITRLAEITEDTRSASIKDRIRAAAQLLRVARDAEQREKASARDASAVPRVSGSSAGPCPSPSTHDHAVAPPPDHRTATVRERTSTNGAMRPVSAHTAPSHKPAEQAVVTSPGRSAASPGITNQKHEEPVKRAKVPRESLHLNGRAA